MSDELDRRLLLGVAGVAGLSALSAASRAGPLNPPSGPVLSTGKTIKEAEPRIPITLATCPGTGTATYAIVAPGSYYLTENLVGEPGKNGISISGNYVTVDLNGFAVQGTGGSQSGVFAVGGFGHRVHNGKVSGWGGSGVDLSNASPASVENVLAVACANFGIRVGSHGVVRGCMAQLNGVGGVQAQAGSLIESCTAVGNNTTNSAGNGGILAGVSALVRSCMARANVGVGISTGGASLIESCQSSENQSHGITAAAGSLVRANAATSNGISGTGANIRVSGPVGRVEGNFAYGAVIGVNVPSGSAVVVINNVAIGNGTNFSIAAGNIVGTIVVGATNPGAINGNTYAGGTGTVDPHANWSG